MLKRTLTVAAVLCLAAGCGVEKTEKLGGMRSATLSDQDNGFIRDISVANLAEIQSSELARQKSGNAQVKEMAEMMINDHTTAATTIEALATSKGARVPKMLDSKHNDMVEDLKGKSGAEFDKAYLKLQVDAHEEAINVDQAEADNGNDGDLKSAANGLLPQLKGHLEKVRTLRANLTGM